jgi:Mrp family chromosome partitioning ATPase
LLLGLIIPLGFIFVRDYFNDKVRDKRDIENIVSSPILGVVGHHKGATNTAVLSKPKSIIAETFRAIRTNLQFIASDQESKIITVTSTFSGEGKTFNAINLASIYSITNKKTVLVGCDLRKPKIHEDFDISNNIGLTTYLIDKCDLDDIIQKTNYDNFHVITAGPVPPNPAELLESR